MASEKQTDGNRNTKEETERPTSPFRLSGTRCAASLSLKGDVGRMNMKRFVTIIIVIIATIIFGAVIFISHRQTELKQQCLFNMQQIYAPMYCCIPAELRLTNGNRLMPEQVARYMRNGQIPRCPCGPEYEIVWSVGGPPPKCPYHGNLMGKAPQHQH